MNEELQAKIAQAATDHQLLEIVVGQVAEVRETQIEDGQCLVALSQRMEGMESAVSAISERCIRREQNEKDIATLKERVRNQWWLVGGTFGAAFLAMVKEYVLSIIHDFSHLLTP